MTNASDTWHVVLEEQVAIFPYIIGDQPVKTGKWLNTSSKWSDHLKVSNLLSSSSPILIYACLSDPSKHILNAVTSPAFYNSYVNLPTHSTLWSHTLQITPSSTPSSKVQWEALDGTHISAHPPTSDQNMPLQQQGWGLAECPHSHYI